MLRTLVYNGWAAGRETFTLCSFDRDWTFDYLEELDGLPRRVMADIDEALLVGFSMGGTMALETLLEFPDRVKGLVLVSTTARMMEDKAVGWVGMSLHRREALMLGTTWAFANDSSPLYAADNLRRGLDYLQNTDLRARLMALPMKIRELPVRILQSERDGIVRPTNAEFLRQIFPRAHVTMVLGTEHDLPVATPELLDRAVAEVRECIA